MRLVRKPSPPCMRRSSEKRPVTAVHTTKKPKVLAFGLLGKSKIYLVIPSPRWCKRNPFLPHRRSFGTLFLFAAYTSSFLEPISVRSRSANRAASKGFLNVSLILVRSILADEPSSGKRAMRITSLNSPFLLRF